LIENVGIHLPEEMSDLQYKYLMDLLTSVNEIGVTTAQRIISLRANFSEFGNIQLDELDQINMHTLRSPQKKEEILQILREVDFSRPIEELYTEKVLKDFLDSRYLRLESLRLDDLEVNVLLVMALGFTTAEEAIDFYIHQKVTIGAATSWGQKALEDLCKIAGAKRVPKDENVKVSGKRFDLKKVSNGTAYYIQLKSGPNTMNVGQVDSLNKMINKIEEDNSGKKAILGMTYGTKSQISPQIRNNLNDFDNRAYIGEELWQFLSGEVNYYHRLVGLINKLSSQYRTTYKHTFIELIERKKKNLAEEWSRKYGNLGSEGLEAFIQQYITSKR